MVEAGRGERICMKVAHGGLVSSMDWDGGSLVPGWGVVRLMCSQRL